MNWKDLLGLKQVEEAAVEDPELAKPETTSTSSAYQNETSSEVEKREPAAPPDLEWWWLVEHRGHQAFYMRTLMPGDFAPGRLPSTRHVRLLERPADGLPTEVRCGTCLEIPRSEDLEVIERSTGGRGFLDGFRSGRSRWPSPTRDESCWMCSDRQAPAIGEARLRGTDVRVCARCANHLGRRT